MNLISKQENAKVYILDQTVWFEPFQTVYGTVAPRIGGSGEVCIWADQSLTAI